MSYKQRQTNPAGPITRELPPPSESSNDQAANGKPTNGKSTIAKGIPLKAGGNAKKEPPESPHAALLRKVASLIEAGKAEEAFDFINARGVGDSVFKNARAVCLMRMSQPALAVRALREICLTSHGTMLRDDIPNHYATNLASALFATGNVAGCRAILEELAKNDLPRVQELKEMIREWEAKMSFWQRFKWKCGIQPPIPTAADQAPADLA